eukprot:TRINITY_DN1191_c0_g1_i2.p1 TRINITY_DN1191_c0_g1~~TRINITY_DN1191_c0_g1_i2.p1  ORF type:complete len:199 (+),score=22.11 TRINITY_DN1191_c0_g1_i2:47-643(+)
MSNKPFLSVDGNDKKLANILAATSFLDNDDDANEWMASLKRGMAARGIVEAAIIDDSDDKNHGFGCSNTVIQTKCVGGNMQRIAKHHALRESDNTTSILAECLKYYTSQPVTQAWYIKFSQMRQNLATHYSLLAYTNLVFDMASKVGVSERDALRHTRATLHPLWSSKLDLAASNMWTKAECPESYSRDDVALFLFGK